MGAGFDWEAAAKAADAYEQEKGNPFSESSDDSDGGSGISPSPRPPDPPSTSSEDEENEEEKSEENEDEEEEENEDEKPQSPGERAKERAKFRRAQRRAKEKLEQHRQAALAEVQQVRQNLDREYGWLVEAVKHYDAGDMDGFADALAEREGREREGWAGLNRRTLERYSSPEYQNVVKLRRELEAERAEKQRQAEQERQARQTAENKAKESQYIEAMKDRLDEIGGPIAVLAEDEGFRRAVLAQQISHYDKATGTSISLAEAAERVLKTVRAKHKLQLRAFGSQQPEKAEKALPGAPKGKPEKRRRTISARNVGSASATPKQFSEQDWAQRWAQRLRNAD